MLFIFWTYRGPFFEIKWGSNTSHLNTRNIGIPTFLKLGFQMVWCSNCWSMCFFLSTTRQNFQRPNQELRKEDGVHLSVFKWSGCPVIKWHSNTGPFGVPYFFNHSNTKLIWYSDPHCIAQNPIQNCTKLIQLNHNGLDHLAAGYYFTI